MYQITAVKWIVRAYFATALAFSFTHITAAGVKYGATTIEAVALTAMIDGFFILGAVMCGDRWSTRARTIGLRVQITAGAASVTGNIIAADTAFGYLFGFVLPLFVVLTEWLADPKQLKSAATEAAELAAAEAQRIVEAAAAKAEADRVARNAAARDRRAVDRAAKEQAERADSRRVRRASRVLEQAAV